MVFPWQSITACKLTSLGFKKVIFTSFSYTSSLKVCTQKTAEQCASFEALHLLKIGLQQVIIIISPSIWKSFPLQISFACSEMVDGSQVNPIPLSKTGFCLQCCGLKVMIDTSPDFLQGKCRFNMAFFEIHNAILSSLLPNFSFIYCWSYVKRQ